MNLARNNGMNPEKPHIVAAIRINELSNEMGKEIIKAINIFSKERPYNSQVIHRHENIFVFIELLNNNGNHKLDDEPRTYIKDLSHVIEK